MTITNSLFDGNPNIVISLLEEPYIPQEEVPQSLSEIGTLTADAQGKVYIIADCTRLSPDFSQVVISMAESGRTTSMLRDKRFVPMIVASGEIFKDVVEWAKQRQYGMMEIGLYQSMDDAIDYAKGQLDNADDSA